MWFSGTRKILAALVFCLPPPLVGGEKVSFYSEQIFQAREQLIAANLHLRYEVPTGFVVRPYLQAGTELTESLSPRAMAAGEGFAYAQPGLRFFGPGVATLFVGPRLRSAYTASLATLDWRALLVFGDFFERAIQPESPWRLFGEIYSETVFSSADENNLVQTAFVRGGLRREFGRHFYADVFLEPFAALTLHRRANQERLDAKASLRLGHRASDLGFSLCVSYLVSRDLPWAIQSGALPASGVRALLVVAGSW